MNMNRSGHSEMKAPDWYSRSTDRAKLSPTNTLETESLQGSLASLNFDSYAALAVGDIDHYSVRSLPVMPSNSSGGSIAGAVDAPWNESPRSLRGGSRSASLRVPSSSGMSALDQLQSSISSLTRPPITIITEEEDPLYIVEDSSTDGEDFNGSLASIHSNGNTRNNAEMDNTAHAGNVSRSSRMVVTTTRVAPPVSPMRSPSRSSSRRGWTLPPSPANSHSASIANRGSFARRGGGPPVVQDGDASLSTLGDGDDHSIQEEDDDSLAIIKLLRNQVETLKSQLINEQEKNQQLKAEALQSKSSDFQLTNCHNSFSSFGHDCTSDADSFGGDDHSSKCGNSPCKTEQVADKFATAQVALTNSVDALRQSWQRRFDATTPVADENDDALMLDELTLCELEGHAKTMQQAYEEQRFDWQAQRDRWQSQVKRQETKIQGLKRQVAKRN
jgi:hypothetical protein